MNWTFFGLMVLFIAYAVNRFVMTEATKKLDDSMKLKIFEVFSKRNNFATVFLLTIALVYFGAIQFMPRMFFLLTVIYLITFILIFGFSFRFKLQKIKAIGNAA